jgi:putative ABC transport system ATP-binding protein
MIIKHLSFKFSQATAHYFFSNLTLTCASGKLHFMQGDNGVGKSTLFSILQGTISGKQIFLDASIELDGTMYTSQHNMLPHAFSRYVHTVRQDYDSMIARQFTFMENLQLANLPRFPGLRRLPSALLVDVVHAFNIDVHTPAHLLSGGQRQLLAILMAMQQQTKILLLDEPTATLDKKNAQLIMQCLQQLAKQLDIIILIICHDKDLVAQYANGSCFFMMQQENGERVIKVC